MTSATQIKQASTQPEGTIVADGLEDIWLQSMASAHEKCVRCWHHQEDIGNNTDHPELCGRCVENVDGAGEERHYA
jgi:isoleucyl-tRNA synthetase